MSTSVPNQSGLFDALLAAAPTLDTRGQQLAKLLYQQLAEGEPVSESRLANGTGLPSEYVAATLASWPGVFRDDAARIIGFWGLALSEMPHTLEVNGVPLYAWCAWDTLFLPGILRAPARVHSLDPQTEEAVELSVTTDGITKRSHPDIKVSFLVPDATWAEDIVTTFCHHVHFFANPTNGRRWTSTRDGAFLLDLDTAFDIGARWNRSRGLV